MTKNSNVVTQEIEQDIETDEYLSSFKIEAIQMLQDAEKTLLDLETGCSYVIAYELVLNILQTLRSAATMLGFDVLRIHLHYIESQFQQCKRYSVFPTPLTTYFLDSFAASLELLAGNKIDFDYTGFEHLQDTLNRAANHLKGGPEILDTILREVETSPQFLQVESEIGPKIISYVAGLDSQNSLFVSKVLFEENFDVILFQTPQQALERIESDQPDAIFLEINLSIDSHLPIIKNFVDIAGSAELIIIDQNITPDKTKTALSTGAHNVIERPLSKIQLGAIARSAGKQARLQKLLTKTVSFMYTFYPELEKALVTTGDKDKLAQFKLHFKELVMIQNAIRNKLR
jgi:chemotaxis protein histidine kinase CheA